ncbi:hypothetical protein BC830DRAFT_1149352 [Chytriomyces sp. MP71]|nr:hypothetical protein BC830DRAFT_1149352 [Chytriomyces sp. MP71]
MGCDCGDSCTCTANGATCQLSVAQVPILPRAYSLLRGERCATKPVPTQAVHSCECGGDCKCNADGKECKCGHASIPVVRSHNCGCGEDCKVKSSRTSQTGSLFTECTVSSRRVQVLSIRWI